MPPQTNELSAELARLVRGRRVVVGLSGGVDSVTLTHLLVRGGADVRAAHVDHGLRVESGADAAFCANIAANLGILFGAAKVEIERGNSTQGRARIQRYAALVRLATELGADVLAVAHHADDAWESSQLQLERGAGAVGVGGPSTWSDWHGFDVVRPLLGVRRQTIERIAAELGLHWREDPSNADPLYAHTRVRGRDDFDATELERRRSAAEALDEAAVVDAIRTPTSTQISRAELAALPAEPRGRALLDAARKLHGELPGALTHDLCAAIGDDQRALRWFCGRRMAVCVGSGSVTLHATRGQGTRLLDARRTPAIALTTSGDVLWFGRQLHVTDQHVGLTLRGPQTGDQIDGTSLAGWLGEQGIAAEERWRWPCLFDGRDCVGTLAKPNESIQSFQINEG